MSSDKSLVMEFDCGNSAAKWRLVSTSKNVAQGFLTYDKPFSSIFDSLPIAPESVGGCRVVSVAPSKVGEALKSSWVSYSSSPIIFAEVEPECEGIQCGYQDISQMGIDRWSALIGASKLIDGACVVVDVGTALTLDILDAQRRHQGGYILPGLNLMLGALQKNTAIPGERIPDLSALTTTAPGKQTASAISGAISLAISAFIVEAFHFSGEGATLVLTGGHSAVAANVVPVEALVKQDLVLDGLKYLVPMGVNN